MSWARGQREGSAVGIQAGVGMGVDDSQAHVGWAGTLVCLRGSEGPGKAMGMTFCSATLLDS